jgi:hypothetical protein
MYHRDTTQNTEQCQVKRVACLLQISQGSVVVRDRSLAVFEEIISRLDLVAFHYVVETADTCHVFEWSLQRL